MLIYWSNQPTIKFRIHSCKLLYKKIICLKSVYNSGYTLILQIKRQRIFPKSSNLDIVHRHCLMVIDVSWPLSDYVAYFHLIFCHFHIFIILLIPLNFLNIILGTSGVSGGHDANLGNLVQGRNFRNLAASTIQITLHRCQLGNDYKKLILCFSI